MKMDFEQLNSPPCTGPRIEVTVQSLHGIASNKSDTIPHVTATIAFSGSASDMQVGSSTLCGTTGQLVIESKAAVIDSAAQQTKNLCGLTTEWRDERPIANCRPHLTVALQECDPKAYKIPLPSINRDSRVVKEVKDLEQYDTDSTISVSTIDSSRQPQSESSVSISSIDSPRMPPSRGSSTFWSNTGAAALPEIVELFVTLKSNDASTDGQVWQGIAHLVVFGHEDDLGTFSMELPVKKASHSELSTSNEQPEIFLTAEARLRIEVKVFPNEDKDPKDHKISSSSSESHEDIVYSRSLLDEQMKMLQKKIQRNEDLALEHVQNQKNAFDVNVPMDEDDDEEYYEGRSAFCSGLWSWASLWQTFSAGVRHCDERTAAVIAVSGDSSDCSTIATRYSLDI